MKVIRCEKPGKFVLENEPMPESKQGYSILKVKRVGICGTDYHAYEGNQPFFEYPRVLGHEVAAEIVETSAKGFKSGDLVTLSPYVYCGYCIACRNGKTNCCVSMNVLGVHTDGAMRDYFSVPDKALINGQGLSAADLVAVEPLAIGAHGVEKANVLPEEFLVVIGAGPIGIATMVFAKEKGAKVIAIDTNDVRLEYCREKIGVDEVVNPAKSDTIAELAKLTNGEMATVVMDCTGNLNAIHAGFSYLAHGGRYVLIGLQKENIQFSHPEFHKREAVLMSSRNALPQDFEHVIDVIKSGRFNVADYITHSVSADQLIENFDQLLQNKSDLIKAVVVFDQ